MWLSTQASEDGPHFEVKRFDSFEASVLYTVKQYNRLSVYATFREARANHRISHLPMSSQVWRLALAPYSALGAGYVDRVLALIHRYDLSQYDTDQF